MPTLSALHGQIILITGAGKGAGRALAVALAERGASLALVDQTPINLDETLRLVQAAGAPARDYICDVGKLMPVMTLVDQVLTDWGRIDVLINVAGVQPHAALLDMDEWEFRRTLEVNLTGPFFTMQRVGRAMVDAGRGGVMINIAADLQRPAGWQGQSAFIASKHGLLALTQAAAPELAAHNIRLHSLCPASMHAADLAQVVDQVVIILSGSQNQ